MSESKRQAERPEMTGAWGRPGHHVLDPDAIVRPGPYPAELVRDDALDERTVRVCIAAIPRNGPTFFAVYEIVDALEALLPAKVDPVKALVDSYQDDICVEWLPDTRSWLEAFARHLISTGRLATQGEVR